VVWVPACAGMTVLKVTVELFPLTASLKTVIPAKAGTHAEQPAE
jgi:hypothetical protein